MRIAQSCPEWTEHNVSDPGITLIELFAWMTDMLIYRVNRMPDKLHVALLELLGVELHGPTAARTDVRFRTVGAGRASRSRSRRVTEVGTVRDGARGVDRLPGRARPSRSRRCQPAAYVVERGGRFSSIGGGGRRRPGRRVRTRLPFDTRPTRGRRALPRLRRGHLAPAHAGRHRRIEGARRRRRAGGPAAALGGQPAGRRLGGGRGARGPHRRLQLRPRHGRAPVSRRRRRSCRWTGGACDGSAAGSPTRPAAVTRRRLHAAAGDPHDHGAAGRRVGAGRARGAARTEETVWGQRRHARLSGSRSRFSPVLPLAAGEDTRGAGARLRPLDAVEPRRVVCGIRPAGPPLQARRRQAARSSSGPAVRQPDGGWTQYGRVPPQGAELRMSALPPRRRRGTATWPPTRSTRVAQRDSRGRVGDQSQAGLRWRRRRVARVRAQARARSSSARGTERSPPRTTSSWCSEASSRVGRTICVPPASPTDADADRTSFPASPAPIGRSATRS